MGEMDTLRRFGSRSSSGELSCIETNGPSESYSIESPPPRLTPPPRHVLFVILGSLSIRLHLDRVTQLETTPRHVLLFIILRSLDIRLHLDRVIQHETTTTTTPPYPPFFLRTRRNTILLLFHLFHILKPPSSPGRSSLRRPRHRRGPKPRRGMKLLLRRTTRGRMRGGVSAASLGEEKPSRSGCLINRVSLMLCVGENVFLDGLHSRSEDCSWYSVQTHGAYRCADVVTRHTADYPRESNSDDGNRNDEASSPPCGSRIASQITVKAKGEAMEGVDVNDTEGGRR